MRETREGLLLSPDGKTIVGFYTDLVTMQGHGYVLRKDNFMPFDVPGASLTNAWDINAQGEIVGVHLDANGKFHGFLRNGDRYFSIDYPNAIATFAYAFDFPGSIATEVWDENPSGALVGNLHRDSAHAMHGFLEERGQFTSIDFPGAMPRSPRGTNPEKMSSVRYLHAGGVTHGFLASHAQHNLRG